MVESLVEFVFDKQVKTDGSLPKTKNADSDLETTAYAVSILFELNLAAKYKATVKKALAYLYAHQEENGKWGNGFDVFETIWTAHVLYAFLKSNIEITSQVVEDGWIWLTKKQKTTGAFCPNDNIFQPHIPSTAAALRTLDLMQDSYEEQKNKALDWLTAVQNKDGGFGDYEKDASQALAAARVLQGVFPYTNYMKSNLGQKAIHFLLGSQQENGTWPAKDENQTLSQTAFCLYVLQKTGTKGQAIQRGFEVLERKIQLERWDNIPLLPLVNIILAFKCR